MDLYRYLFAPVLVAVAIGSGRRERPPPRPPEPPAVVAPAAMVAPEPPGPAAEGSDPSLPGAEQRTASDRPAHQGSRL
jgi:hypothetical protein